MNITRQTLGIRIAAALLLTLAATTAARAQQAMLMDVAGDVTATSAGKTGKAEILSYLATGAELALADKASVKLVLLANSTELRLAGPGRFRIQADRVDTLQGNAPTATSLNAAVATQAKNFQPAVRDRMALAALSMRSVEEPRAPRLRRPDDLKVLSQTPQFLWQPPASTDSAADLSEQTEITVWDQSGTVVWKQARVRPGVQIAAPLPAGAYDWSVAVNGVSAPRAHFEIAPDSERAAEPSVTSSATFSDRLNTAITWENDGYSHDAWMLWKQLASERPDNLILQRMAQ